MDLDETNPLALEQDTAIDTSEPEAIEADDGPIDIDAPTEPETSEEPDEPEDIPAADPFTGYEEIEHDGKRYRVPAELKDGYLRTADYTRKTQEVAEMRRQAEARTAEIEARAQVSDEEMQARAAMINVSGELEKFQNLDWQKFHDADPLEAQSQYMRFQQLEKTAQNIANYQQNLQQQRSQQAEQDIATRLRTTAEYAQKEIKGWTPELDHKITEYAIKELGFTRDTLARSYNPQVYKVLHRAFIGEQTLQRQSVAKPASTPVEPTRTVTAKGSPMVSKNLEDMSMSEYADYRANQERKRK